MRNSVGIATVGIGIRASCERRHDRNVSSVEKGWCSQCLNIDGKYCKTGHSRIVRVYFRCSRHHRKTSPDVFCQRSKCYKLPSML